MYLFGTCDITWPFLYRSNIEASQFCINPVTSSSFSADSELSHDSDDAAINYIQEGQEVGFDSDRQRIEQKAIPRNHKPELDRSKNLQLQPSSGERT